MHEGPTHELADLPILRELGADLHDAFGRHQRRASRRSDGGRRQRWAVVAGAVAVVGAASVVALTSGLDAGHVAPAPATAAQALRQAAAAAEDRPAPFPRDDQFFYVHSRGTGLVAPASVADAARLPTALVTGDRRIWTSISRGGRLRERTLAVRFPTQAERRKWERAGKPLLGAVPDSGEGIPVGPERRYHLGDSALTRRQMLDYPTDPHVIYARLRSTVGDRGNSPDGEVFTELGDALREAPAPAQLRAALYRTLALVPGVQLVGPVSDSVGRKGTAVAFTERGVRHELLFDTATSQMLAERDVLVDPALAQLNLPAGTVFGDTTYLERDVTDTVTAP